MKKVFALFMTLAALSFCFAGTRTVAGSPDELVVFHDYAGGAYVLYTEAGQLHTLKVTSDGQFEDYNPFHTQRNIRNVRMLKNDRFSSASTGGFIGTENGREQIYIFRVDTGGMLSFYHEAVADMKTGGIETFTIIGKRDGTIDVYYLKNSALIKAMLPREKSGRIIYEYVSDAGERVSSYEVKPAVMNRENLQYGWYLTEKNTGYREAVFFLTEDNNIRQTEKVQVFSPDARVEIKESFRGTIYFNIYSADTMTEFSVRNKSFVRTLEIGMPEKIKQYIGLDDLAKGAALVVTGGDDGDRIYRFEHIHLNAPRSEEIEIPAGSVFEGIIYLDYTKALILLREPARRETLLLNIPTGEIEEKSTVKNPGAKVLYAGNPDYPVLLLHNDAEILFLKYQDGRWESLSGFACDSSGSRLLARTESSGIINLHEFLTGRSRIMYLETDGGIIEMDNTAKTAVHRAGVRQWQSLNLNGFRWRILFNGKELITVLPGE
ncbi:hypothetical protein K7I13_09290 [Brucepastera parasyntrophica]|uniref:hypothetical protein n=1 Tax=Brucepastera parasyntrophica TaxID=2880008 RepID=UPI00210C52BE|nr:hypothetical protein [Brucepastera parasyntrophica]ULQ58744.1 hypothetical protein K7I13_09290 [Brucepastera parasyntrophica]